MVQQKLHSGISTSEELDGLLKHNGKLHKNYKMYTSMEQAMSFLLSGNLYLTNGSNWNDKDDRELMKIRNTFAKSFSWSTAENIAMWMLYGDDCGRNGAMLNFTKNMISEIMSNSCVSVGKFERTGFHEYLRLKLNKDFHIYMTDIVYIEELTKSNQVRLTYQDEHITKEAAILEGTDTTIFYKNYAWKYEKECRMVLRLNESTMKTANENECDVVKIKVPEVVTRRMIKEERLIQSPVLNRNVDYGQKSALAGKVDWKIGE